MLPFQWNSLLGLINGKLNSPVDAVGSDSPLCGLLMNQVLMGWPHPALGLPPTNPVPSPLPLKSTFHSKTVCQLSLWVMLWSQTTLSKVSTIAIPKGFGIVAESPAISILEVWPSTQAIEFFIFIFKVSASFVEMAAYPYLRTQLESDSSVAYLSLMTTISIMWFPALFSQSTLFFQDTPGLSALAPSQEIKKECGG